jgi:hypothetical protein
MLDSIPKDLVTSLEASFPGISEIYNSPSPEKFLVDITEDTLSGNWLFIEEWVLPLLILSFRILPMEATSSLGTLMQNIKEDDDTVAKLLSVPLEELPMFLGYTEERTYLTNTKAEILRFRLETCY